jgi:hypothetical protein
MQNDSTFAIPSGHGDFSVTGWDDVAAAVAAVGFEASPLVAPGARSPLVLGESHANATSAIAMPNEFLTPRVRITHESILQNRK